MKIIASIALVVLTALAAYGLSALVAAYDNNGRLFAALTLLFTVAFIVLMEFIWPRPHRASFAEYHDKDCV